MRLVLPLLSCLLAALPIQAAGLLEHRVKAIEQGNQAYADQHYQQALKAYEQAEQHLSGEPRLHFNRGDALFKLGRTKEAREAYLRAMGLRDPDLKKRNLFNIGNTFLSEKAYQDAIAYYRRALELDPGFDEARINLELALRALQKQKQQNQNKNKDQDKDKNEDKNKKQNDKKKQQQDQQNQQKEQQQQDQQQRQQDQKQQQKDQQQQDQQQRQQGQKQQQKDQQQQQKEQQQQQNQQKQKQQQQQEQQKQSRQSSGQPPKGKDQSHPLRLSPEQVQSLLEAARDNEKPFQMFRYSLPRYQHRQSDKDW